MTRRLEHLAMPSGSPRVLHAAWALSLAGAFAASAAAQPSAEQDRAPATTPATPASAESAPANAAEDVELGAAARVPTPLATDRAHSVVRRAELDERLPHSAPDALRYEPGVYVQQTAHGQASPYVRGLTGQQVVHVFDGVRMNNGLLRQGPNQYFFTVDSYTLERIEVIRGSASTLYGSDALGGAIIAYGRDPLRGGDADPLELHPRLYGRFASADLERGGRAELELSLHDRTGLLLGGGYREAERLTSGGLVGNPGRRPPFVPRFEDDGRTQLGTGFREATFDARVIQRVLHKLRAVGAVYGYRQFDTPRTDLCPPPEAPISECLSVQEQFRTLAYAALRGDAGPVMREVDLNVSYQRHDELRVNDRPRSFVRTSYDNGVYTLGAALRARTAPFALSGGDAFYRVRYGAEAYRDEVDSRAVQQLTDPTLIEVLPPEALTTEYSRGQYVDGSVFVSSGLFGELEISPVPALTLYGGGRLAAVGANVPRDALSGSAAAAPRWAAAVGRAGVTAQVHRDLTLHANFDQGFRAPNLDDLSSRQQVGPGYQLENPALEPERSYTFEVGATGTPGPLSLQVWAFATLLHDAITRAVRDRDDCPPEADACRASRTQLQLVNARAEATILGAEAALEAALPAGFALRATYAYDIGAGEDPSGARAGERVPLSRIPPMNDTVETRYEALQARLYAAAVLRWALAQRRLATSDLSDPRIPPGGTPGYAVWDLRAGFRYSPDVRFNLVFENVFDAAYRVHGSSINGRGRGVLLGVVAGF